MIGQAHRSKNARRIYSEKQTARLDELLKLNLASIKGYLLRRTSIVSGTTNIRTSRESFPTTG